MTAIDPARRRRAMIAGSRPRPFQDYIFRPAMRPMAVTDAPA